MARKISKRAKGSMNLEHWTCLMEVDVARRRCYRLAHHECAV